MTDLRVASAAQAARDVPDPELPHLTLGDLGVIRAVNETEDGIEVVVTPTYTGCPATEEILGAVRHAVMAAGWEQVEVRTELFPPWTTDDITERGRERLRRAGIAAAPTLGPDGDLEAALALPVPCPRCGSVRTRRLADHGSTACKAMYRCEACAEPFEQFKPI